MTLKNYIFSSETIDSLLRVGEAIIAVNFGGEQLFETMNIIVSGCLVQMTPEQFGRGLMYLASANYKLGDIQFTIESALKNLLKDDPIVVYRQTSTPNLEVAIIYYLTLTGLFSAEYLKPTAKWMVGSPQKMIHLTPEHKTILGLVKAIHQNDSPPLFEGIPFTYPQDLVFFPPSSFSQYFDEFFYFLFYNDVKKNIPIGPVNVHYAQQHLGLICADYQAHTGVTGELNGLHALAKMTTETILHEVTMVKQSEMDRLEKKNQKMHLLRGETKKWKADNEAREQHYEKASEGFLKVNEI
jgi:hypothetical protein